MTSDILQLVRIDHDNSENSRPFSEKVIGVFIGGAGKPAHRKATDWFEKQKPTQLYLGYDGKVYPVYRLVKMKVLL